MRRRERTESQPVTDRTAAPLAHSLDTGNIAQSLDRTVSCSSAMLGLGAFTRKKPKTFNDKRWENDPQSFSVSSRLELPPFPRESLSHRNRSHP